MKARTRRGFRCFEDAEFAARGRDVLYYARPLQEPAPVQERARSSPIFVNRGG